MGKSTLIRSLCLCMAVASLLVGCVSIGGPSPSASAALGRSFGITTPAPIASATAGASADATQAPLLTPSPTSATTATPTAEPTATPAAEPTETPTATPDDLVLFDNMEDPAASRWGETETESTTVSMEPGALRFEIRQELGAAYSSHPLPSEYAVLQVAAEFNPADDGAIGVLCSASDDIHYGAAFTTNGALIFFSIDNGQIASLKRINDVGSDLQVNEATTFGLECAGTATGALRLVAVLPGSGPLAVYQSDEGPQTFNGIAVYGEAFGSQFSVDVTQAGAYGITGTADGSVTPEGEELLTHAPESWQQTCTESPISQSGVAMLHCYLQVDGAGIELAQYQAFSTNEEMDAAYQESVEQYGVEPTGSCESGPNETTWSIDDQSFGRVQCAPQQVGIRFDWTDDRLSILSTLIDLDGDYGLTYQAWLEAGPNP